MPRALPFRVTFLLLAVAFLDASPARAEEHGRKYALLVGCQNYYNRKDLNPLRYAHNDIRGFAEALRQSGFAAESIFLMYDSMDIPAPMWPEARKVRDKLDGLLALPDVEDTLVIALSGHGVRFQDDRANYFCPVDAKLNDRSTLLRLDGPDGLYQKLEKCKAGRKLLVVDACRNDPLSDLARGTRQLVDFAPAEKVPGGIVALFSCSPEERSYEFPPEKNIKHSIFFHHFLEAWNGAAQDREGKLTLSEVVKYTFRNTKDTAFRILDAQQVPQQKNEVSGDDWVLWRDVVGEIRSLEGHQGRVRSVAYGADGKRALSAGGFDKDVRLWDLEKGREIRRFRGHDLLVYSVAFAPDGRRAASASADGTVRLWEVETAKQLHCLKGHDGDVLCVAFSTDGSQVLSGGSDGIVRLWDVASGRALQRLKGHKGKVWGVAFSAGKAVSGGDDGCVRLWDLTAGQEVRCLEGHKGRVWAVAFAPDGKHVLSGGADLKVRLWDVEAGKEIRNFVGHTGEVVSVAFSPDGKRALSGGVDWTLRLWDIDSGIERCKFPGHKHNVLSVAFSPDGRRALSGSVDNTLRLWGLPRR